MQPIRWFTELSLADVAIAGGKGANLGELTRAEVPVPAGFVITSEAYISTIEQTGARDELRQLLAGLDAEDAAGRAAASNQAIDILRATSLPADLAEAIRRAYHELGDDVRVAVRSSGTSEDAGDTSFAGMNVSFTNVAGEQDVLARVLDLGIEVVSIGSNDLTQLTLGVDRDSEVCAELFDEADPADPDAVASVRQSIAAAEWRLVLDNSTPSHPPTRDVLPRHRLRHEGVQQ